MTTLKGNIEFDILLKLYDKIDETPLEKWAESERGNIQRLIETMIDEASNDENNVSLLRE